MTSMLSNLFSRDPTAQFQWDLNGEIVCNLPKGSILKKTKRKIDPKENASLIHQSTDNYGHQSLKNWAQKLRTMRHPNILTFLDLLETDKQIALVVEVSTPVEFYYENIQMTDEQKKNTVVWGIYQILSALKFLHSDAKLCHNNIQKGTFVTLCGDWKIGDLSAVAPFSSQKSDLEGLFHLIWDVFNDGFSTDIDSPKRRQPGKIPKTLQSFCLKLIKEAHKLTAQNLLSTGRSPDGPFSTKFVDTLLFLDEYQLKDSREKQAFFASLKDSMQIFPENVAQYKILPKLIQAWEFGDVGAVILPHLLATSKNLPEDEYQRMIIPCIIKLFASPDRSIRVKLLEKLEEIVSHLSENVINDQIFGNICHGFMDVNPAIREATVKSMIILAPKLNNNNLNIELMKYFARLQGRDDQPSIRTNTTICLGKIAAYLAPDHRQKILISAFTRATKDTFPPARLASVLALSATQQFYTLSEIANKVLPSIVSLTYDPDKQVRDQTFKSLRGFIEKLEIASENPEKIIELESAVESKGLSAKDAKLPQWANWALNAITGGKFYKGPVPPPNQPAAQATDAPSTSEAISKPNSPPPPVKTDNDGWDDDMLDDFDDNNADWDEPKTIETRPKIEVKSSMNIQSKWQSKKSPNNDLVDLLGDVGMSKKAPKSINKNDGWGDEEFLPEPAKSPKKSAPFDGWEEDNDSFENWTEPKPSKSVPSNRMIQRKADREARKIKQESQPKQTEQKKKGAMKLTAKKVISNDDFNFDDF